MLGAPLRPGSSGTAVQDRASSAPGSSSCKRTLRRVSFRTECGIVAKFVVPGPIPTTICQRMFSNKANVAGHESTHAGKKPYPYSICPMWFSEKGNVTKHERTHTGE